MAKIPWHFKVQGLDTKRLLKKVAARYVPADVLFRPKKGFNMPIGEWIRTVLARPIEELLFDRNSMTTQLFRTEEIHNMMADIFKASVITVNRFGPSSISSSGIGSSLRGRCGLPIFCKRHLGRLSDERFDDWNGMVYIQARWIAQVRYGLFSCPD